MNLWELDHVAIEASDPEATAAWYVETLGFERRHKNVWGSYPIFVCIGSSGLAIFPRPEGTVSPRTERQPVRHIAFRTGMSQFQNARAELDQRGIEVKFSDHTISQSIYFADPDGIRLEITTYEIGVEETS